MRIVLSLTVTDLDSFRRYRDNEEMTLADLLRKLRREEPPSDAMRAGTALHSILEHPPTEELVSVERDGHRFRFDLDAELPLLGSRELFGRRSYTVRGEEVEIRGKVDAIDGLTIEDHKLTQSAFDAERYFSSYQWRCYLSIFRANVFRYNVFTGKFVGFDEHGISEWEITDFQPFTLYRYPEMEADIVDQLADYASFAHTHLLGGRAA